MVGVAAVRRRIRHLRSAPLNSRPRQIQVFPHRVTATDPAGEALTFATTGSPTHGTLTSFSANGSFVYQPSPGVTGQDTFGIRVTDAGGNQVMGSVTITVNPNRPPAAANDIMRAEGTALDAINVLKNDSDPDSDKLTVSIEGTPLVGTASVNADSTVRLTGLGGFKGVTRFSYRITDTDGASSVATAAIFVGTDPFRVFFAQDVPGSGPEVYVNDMAADPRAVTKATEGSLRLKGFQVSDNGATVVVPTRRWHDDGSLVPSNDRIEPRDENRTARRSHARAGRSGRHRPVPRKCRRKMDRTDRARLGRRRRLPPQRREFLDTDEGLAGGNAVRGETEVLR